MSFCRKAKTNDTKLATTRRKGFFRKILFLEHSYKINQTQASKKTFRLTEILIFGIICNFTLSSNEGNPSFLLNSFFSEQSHKYTPSLNDPKSRFIAGLPAPLFYISLFPLGGIFILKFVRKLLALSSSAIQP